MAELIEDKLFDKTDFKTSPFLKAEYEKCTFVYCDFSSSDLSNSKFIDCTFKGCNLSLAKISNTSFQDVIFLDSKMLGLRFESCNAFLLSFRFETCILDHSSFFRNKIKKTVFKDCQLREIDFTETDLTGSLFTNCDLDRAIFANTILEKCDLRSSYNYSIDPENNHMKKARFSMTGVKGLLDKYDIDIE
jgi:uncharacterized protein YjbI with pentapeptide repeats